MELKDHAEETRWDPPPTHRAPPGAEQRGWLRFLADPFGAGTGQHPLRDGMDAPRCFWPGGGRITLAGAEQPSPAEPSRAGGVPRAERLYRAEPCRAVPGLQ